jgi:hypothetical protein
MEIVSTTDSYEQSAAALAAHGYEAEPKPTAAPPSADSPVEQVTPPTEEIKTDPDPDAGLLEQVQPGVKPAPKKKQSAQERIDEITAQRYEERGRLQAEIDRLKASIEGKPADKPIPPPVVEPMKPERPKRPKQSEFDTTEEFETADGVYDTAMEKYETDLATYTEDRAVAKFQQQQAQEASVARVTAIHAAGLDKYSDYEDVVQKNDAITISTAMLDAIGEYENAEDFLHFIGTHPAEAAEYVADTFTPGTTMYSPREARAAGRIVANLAAQFAAAPVAPLAPLAAPATDSPAAPPAVPPVAAPVPTRRITAAPAPIAPLRPSAAAGQPDPKREIGKNGWTVAKERELMKRR